MRCYECKYWEKINKLHEPYGECRRFPPVFTSKEDWWSFPLVILTASCGEFRSNPHRRKKSKTSPRPIKTIGVDSLSPRAMIALSGVGLRETQGNSAFKQLANVSANQLLAVKGVGPITIAEIRDKLASCGIKLKGE